MRNHGLRLTGILLVGTEEFFDLLTNFTLGHLDIILGGTVVRHERQKAIISDIELLVCQCFFELLMIAFSLLLPTGIHGE